MVSAEVLRERKALAEEALRQRFEIARKGPSESNKRRVSFDNASPTDTEETAPNDTTNNYSTGYDQGGMDPTKSTEMRVSFMDSDRGADDDTNHEKKKKKKKSKKSKKSHKKSSKKSKSKKKHYPEETRIRKRKKNSSSSTSKKSTNDEYHNHHALSAHVKGFSGLGYAVLWLIWLSTGTFFFGCKFRSRNIFYSFIHCVLNDSDPKSLKPTNQFTAIAITQICNLYRCKE